MVVIPFMNLLLYSSTISFISNIQTQNFIIMYLICTQKTENGYNLLFSNDDYNFDITYALDCSGLSKIHEKAVKLPEDKDFMEMVKYITDVYALFNDENSPRNKGISSNRFVILELARMYNTHGYDLSVFTYNEREKNLNKWGRALAKELKEELGFHHVNTSYSDWSYKKGKYHIFIPYTMENNGKHEAVVTTGYGEDKRLGLACTLEEVTQLIEGHENLKP